MKKTLLMIGIVFGCCCMAALPPLFENHASSWKIIVSEKATVPEKYAAEELQTYLKKISETELPIESAVTENEAAIIIGTQETVPELASFGIKQDVKEQMLIRLDGNRLYLGGNMPRAVLYAVYAFLRDELGCRWFWPGDDGEFIVKRDSFSIPPLNKTIVPPFQYREMTPCGMHYHVPTEMWFARNLLNRGSRTVAIRDKQGLVRAGGGHRVSISKKEFEAHPDYFSLLSGKRDPSGNAGCWSNPGFTDYVVKNIVKYARDNQLEHLNVFPADITQRCECAECRANPDASSRWYNYYSHLIDKIREELPDMTFGGIAYQEYRAVPKGNVEKLQYVQHCQYSRCYVHKFGDPSCSLNAKTLAEFNAWFEKVPMGIYGYEFDAFSPCMYQPCWNMLQDEIKVFRDKGVVYVKTELSVRYPKNAARSDINQLRHRLPNYIYAQLLMNPDVDMDVLIDDWCSYVYGAAAKPMGEYHRKMAAAWDNMKICLTYFGAKPDGTSRFLLNDKLIAEAKKLFDTARDMVKDDKRALDEVELETELFKLWENYYRIANSDAIVVTLPKLDGDNRFDELSPFKLKDKERTTTDNLARLYWNDDALHIRVDMPTPEMTAIPEDKAIRDVSPWGKRSVELFLTDGQVSPYWQLAANPMGVIYDAQGNDKNWNPDWIASSVLQDGIWKLTMKIPFASLNKPPKAQDCWMLVIDANSPNGAAGLPYPVYHDMPSGVQLYFSANSNPDKTLAWISRPRKEGSWFNTHKSILFSRGWQCRHADGADEAMTLDLDGCKLIVIENYQNRFSQEFFDNKLVPAVKNGAVVMFLCYFWVEKLHEQFRDELFRMKFVEKAHPTRRNVGIYGNSFGTTPNKLKGTLHTTPSGYFSPAHPEAWERLLTQYDPDSKEQPYMLARPLGKGMVVLMGSIYQDLHLLDNVLEYNKAITR
ncbi:MAG: DUF4838 domain-containing protein [Victivallales bacterium]|nr:DUF4838 domain-containing protein [Victivallales bacterium]